MTQPDSLSTLVLPLRPLPSFEALQRSLNSITTALNSGQGYDSWDRDYVLSFATRLLSKLECEFAEQTNLIESASALVLRLNNNCLDSPDDDLLRTFTYPYVSPFTAEPQPPVEIQIRDGRYGGDIGSQTWNSAPLLSKKLCAQPLTFFHPFASASNSQSIDMFTPPPTRPTSPVPRQPYRILELGSGTGLTGLTAGLVLARLIKEARAHRPDLSLRPIQLVLTDYLKPVLENLEYNLSLNAEMMRVDGLDVSVELLDWRDLQSSNVKGTFDLVLGTDLVYEVQHADWAANVVDHFLAWPTQTSSSAKQACTMPPTPVDSRATSPAPFTSTSSSSTVTAPSTPPSFHLVLALRPTFRAESTAVHTAFDSSFGLPINKDSDMPLPERQFMPSSEGPALIEGGASEGGIGLYQLLTRSCETLVGVSHGQGCGDYQYLMITRP